MSDNLKRGDVRRVQRFGLTMTGGLALFTARVGTGIYFSTFRFLIRSFFACRKRLMAPLFAARPLQTKKRVEVISTGFRMTRNGRE